MNSVLKALIEAPEEINPAIVLQQRLTEQQPGVTELLALKPEIDRTIQAAQREIKDAEQAFRDLTNSEPITSRRTPEGF